jgi:lipopolysaccharide biosynthesis regulator YciM
MAWFRRRPRAKRDAAAREELFQRALGHVLREDWAAAEQELSDVVTEDSRDTGGYLVLAQLYRRRGEVGRAIRVHQNLLLRDGISRATRVEVLYELAQDFGVGGFEQRAITSYEEILQLDTKHLGALEGLLDALVGAGDYARAPGLYKRLRRAGGSRDAEGEAVLFCRLALSARDAGDSTEARRFLKRGLRRFPNHVDSLYLLGELEVARNKNRAAAAIWRRVIEMGGPGAAKAYDTADAGSMAVRQGRRHEEFLRELLDESPDCLAARIALGEVLLKEHRDPDALKEFGELLEVLRTKPEILMESGE